MRCHDSGMAKAIFDQAALSAILKAQDQVISRQQALACGMTPDALKYRIRQGGPWQKLLEGIYLAQTGAPSVVQKEMAALLHGGPESVLTGQAALRNLGISPVEPVLFDVLVPLSQAPRSVAFVRIHRTAHMPLYVIRDGRSCALAPRALADAARSMSDLREVRGLIIAAIQRRACPLGALSDELSEGPRRNSALLRQVLAEAAEGIRSVVEAEFKELIERARLPKPMFNSKLFTAEGTFIATPDAWWPEAGVAAEVDSREWHLTPDGWEKTMRRHDLMISYGILPLHFSPSQIRRDPATVVAAITGSLRAGRARPRLPIIARPA
jgi:hypothetical protein